MKKRIVAGFAMFVAGVACAISFEIDATKPGRELPNTAQVLTTWTVPQPRDPKTLVDIEWDVRDFAEYVEIMAATGGNVSRDCYVDPRNRKVLDDYDFSKLVEGCRGIVALGMKPYLKLGNVPMKLSSDISNGDFLMNIRPPDDFAAYERYMEACAKALLAAFGREELLKWRFAVLSEYENNGWFKDVSGDAERTFHAYCLLYEVTVRAFGRMISTDLCFGAHAMAVTESHWDERRFFAFVAVRKLPLRFVTASYYQVWIGDTSHGFTLSQTIEHLRKGAEKVGLKGLFYGVDEGRILKGARGGRCGRNLNLRIVGDTYQAAFDARIAKDLFDSGADYFASWGYLTGPNAWFDGIPSISFHVAKEVAKFKGMRRLPVVASDDECPNVESAAVAAMSDDGQRVRVMAYSYTNSLHAVGMTSVRFAVRFPETWRGKKVTLTQWMMDDNANWFRQWREDRKKLGLADDHFSWSPDDPAVLGGKGLIEEKDRAKFRDELLPRYRALARLEPRSQTVRPAESPFGLNLEIQVNSVMFMEFERGDDK